MPDHADAPVARLAARLRARLVAPDRSATRSAARPLGRAQRLLHRHVHRVELVVAGHLLDERAAARVLEHDEVAHQVEEAPLVEHALEQHLQLRQVRVGQRLARDRAPGLEPLRARRRACRCAPATPSETTSTALYANSDGISRLVGLELLEGRPDRGVLVGGVLQLDDRQRQAVDEQHHVRPARVLVLDDGELVDGQPVVVVRVVEVDAPAPARRAIEPSGVRYSTVTPSTSSRCTARLRADSAAPSGRVSLRKASSSASAGRPRLSRASASRSRCASTTCP